MWGYGGQGQKQKRLLMGFYGAGGKKCKDGESGLKAYFNYIMGNSSQHLESRTSLTQHWTPHGKESNVLVNKQTKEQVQRHFLKILGKDLPRQISHFASRMSNHQPYICRLQYFHPAVSGSRNTKQEKSLREMFLYTDRMLPLQQWNRDNIVMALTGLEKLIAIHGPIKITVKMICQNQIGEMKVWVSENPINNYPDSKYTSEQQTLADLAAILVNKNQELASKLLGCHTVSDAIQRLNQLNQENKSLFNNYSHRASESDAVKFKKYEVRVQGGPIQPYRNVFGDMTVQSQPKVTMNLTPNKTKNTALSPNLLKRPEEQSKPTSNISQYHDFHYTNSAKKPLKEDKFAQRAVTNSRVVNETSLQFRPYNQNESRPNVKNTSRFDFTANRPKLNSGGTLQTKKSPLGFHRFETHAQLSSPTAFNYTSQKGFKATQRQNFQNMVDTKVEDHGKIKSFYSSAPDFNLVEGKRGQNEIISKVSKNANGLILLKKGSDDYMTKPNREEDEVYSNFQTKINNSVQKKKEKSNFVPVFLQQKKQFNHLNEDHQFLHTFDADKGLNRQDTIDSNLSPANVPQEPQHFFNIEKKTQPKKEHQQIKTLWQPQHKNQQKNPQRNTPAPIHNSPVKFISQAQKINAFYPKTPTPAISVNGFQSGLSGFHAMNNNSTANKMNLRTKTTDFYCKGKDLKGDSIQNKSLTLKQQKELEAPRSHKPLEDNFVKNLGELTQPNHFEQHKEQSSVSPAQKTNLKKQLRQEFTFLLGGDPPAKEEAPPPKEKVQANDLISSVQSLEGRPEVEVKEKIIKKQMAFAQLKKEAMKVLIGLD